MYRYLSNVSVISNNKRTNIEAVFNVYIDPFKYDAEIVDAQEIFDGEEFPLSLDCIDDDQLESIERQAICAWESKHLE